ncbi:DUF4232 domain-containing protein [Geodermatophilus sp. SYSU D00815]
MARGRWRSTPYVLLAGGFLVMLLAGSAAGRYSPGWFDPGDPLPCGCSPEEAASARASLWIWVAAGAVGALAGTLLLVRRLDPAPRRPAGPLPTAAHALLAGMVGFVVPVVLFLPVVFLLLVGDHLVPLAALGAWLVHAAAVAGADRGVGAEWSSPRRSWLTGLAAGALGSGAAWAVLLAWPTARNAVPAVVDAAVVALTVLAARTLLAPRGGGSRAGRVVGTVAAAGAVALVVVAVLAPAALLPRPEPVVAAGPVPAVPTTEPPVAPPTGAAPAPATTPPPVEAEVPCDPADLRFAVTGWDAAMGARSAAVEATNTGTRPCWVAGVPVVTLLQGGRPLALTVEEGRTADGSPPVVQRVGLAPGGHAYALLDWRTYAGWADAETPQSVTVALAPGAPAVDVPVAGGHGPAPFDIADGGTWGIAPWAPPWN